MIDGYLRQGYNFCNLQGNWKWKKKVIVVIFIPRKCFDQTGVHRGFIELNWKPNKKEKKTPAVLSGFITCSTK